MKLTKKILYRVANLTLKWTVIFRQWRHSGVFIVNFEQILHLVFLLLILNM